MRTTIVPWCFPSKGKNSRMQTSKLPEFTFSNQTYIASSGFVLRAYLADTNTEGLPPKLCKLHKLILQLMQWEFQAMFTRVRTNFWIFAGKNFNLQGSTLRLHGTGETGRIFEGLSVQVWDLKKAGPKLTHLAVQKSVQFRRSHVNARRKRASFCPCKNLFGPVWTGPQFYLFY